MDNLLCRNFSKLNIFQWNAQSLKTKLIDFDVLLNREKVHIAVISETWLNEDDNIRISGYNIYRQDRSDGYGGVAIVSHHSVRTEVCHTFSNNSDIECLHVKIHNCNNIDNIYAIYCPPSAHTTQRDWENLFSRMTLRSLILGDFNGHHHSWSNKTDRRGNQIFDSLVDSRFIVLNNNSIATRIKLVNNRLQKSSPDISLVSADIALNFDWIVINESLGSDHVIIKLTLNYFISTNNFIKKRNYKLSNWLGYSSEINSSLSDRSFPVNVQLGYDILLDCMNRAADIHIPFIKINLNPSNNFKPKFFWNMIISKSVAERRLALSVFRDNPIPGNYSILQDKICAAQRIVRQSKSKSWHKFCNSICEVSSINEMWFRMKWIKGRYCKKSFIPANSARKLLNSLAPDFVINNCPNFQSSNSQLESVISRKELEVAVKSKDSAPGIDMISFSMINNLPDRGKEWLLKLFNLFLRDGVVPNQWREIAIIPIPKPGRDPESISSLRPISLMSCVCKVFHSILNKRLEWYFEKSNTFSVDTTGFRKAHSCLDNLSKLILYIQLGFGQANATSCCFIDIDGAYNNIDIHKLLTLLDNYGVGSKICYYLWSFLSVRYLSIKSDTLTEARCCSKGLAQGDPLSPLLFNIATAHICQSIKNVFISQYADDFVLYTSNKKLRFASNELQLALSNFTTLLDELGLRVSPTKSKVCIFTRAHRGKNIDLSIDGVPLEVVENVKYLGLLLNRKLKWGPHIDNLRGKIYKFLNLFKMLAGSGWGIHPKYLTKLYVSILRSRIDYASFLFDDAPHSHLTKLDQIQNQSMRVIGGFIRTTPIHVMESELALPPLYIRRQYLGGKYLLKAKSLENHTIISFLNNFASFFDKPYWIRRKKPLLIVLFNEIQNFPIHRSKKLEMFNLSIWVSKIDLEPHIQLKIPYINKAKRFYNELDIKTNCINYLNLRYPNYYKLYTDASIENNNIGIAFYDPQEETNMRFKSNYKISIMYAELIALAEALSYIETINFDRFVIFTDSKSALQHLTRCTSTFRGTPIANTIIEIIFKLKSLSKNVLLQWIPSHVGIVGNEKVDIYAKEAGSDGNVINVLPFYTDCLYFIKEKCRNNWKEYFNKRSKEKGIWYKTIQPQPCYHSWIDICKLNRDDIVTAFRLRSGHIPLNKFGFLMKKVLSPNCPDCGVVEDVYHILTECTRSEPLLSRVADRTIGSCNLYLANPTSDLAKLLYSIVKLNVSKRK